jgi:hypothetical protein
MKRFYLHDGKAQRGPYDIDELRQQNISPQTPVWTSTLKDWTPAEQVEELKSLFTSTAPPSRKSVQTQFRPPAHRKPWIFVLSIASIIFAAIIIFANKKNKETDQSNVDSSGIAVSKKSRQQELDEKERQRLALENAQEIINREYRNNWGKYIIHKTNKFKVGFFGGISELEITVTNNTENLVDEVVIKIDYIKESGDLWETKDVVVNNIQPGTSKTVKAPESSRGIQIKTRITSITAKSLSFCYDTTTEKQKRKSNPADPWKCR